MKACNRFHIEDVEAGDRLGFTMHDGAESQVIVKRVYHTVNFGWVVETTEPVGTTLYLDDFDDVRAVPESRGAGVPSMLRVNGVRFFCHCAVGVFTHFPAVDVFVCNGCGEEYTGDQAK